MLKNNKLQKTIGGLLALMVLAVFISGFFQLQDKVSESCRHMSQSFAYTASAVMNIGRAINGGEENRGREKESEEHGSTVFLSVPLLFNNMNLAAIVTLILIALCLYRVPVQLKTMDKGISRRKYYREWYLKFLNPVQKSILERLDQYDINPVRIIKREGNPCFVLKAEHGFFL